MHTSKDIEGSFYYLRITQKAIATVSQWHLIKLEPSLQFNLDNMYF